MSAYRHSLVFAAALAGAIGAAGTPASASQTFNNVSSDTPALDELNGFAVEAAVLADRDVNPHASISSSGDRPDDDVGAATAQQQEARGSGGGGGAEHGSANNARPNGAPVQLAFTLIE
jgi:hypothetical protein